MLCSQQVLWITKLLLSKCWRAWLKMNEWMNDECDKKIQMYWYNGITNKIGNEIERKQKENQL